MIAWVMLVMYAEGGTLLYDQLGLNQALSTKGIVPHSDQILDYHSPIQYQATFMHVHLLARTRSPTFYLYRRTIFLSRNIKHVNVSCKFKSFASSHICVKNKVLQGFGKTSSRLFQHIRLRDIRAILQPQGYRLHGLQPQHVC